MSVRRDQQRPRMMTGEATPGGCRQGSKQSAHRPGSAALLRLLLRVRGLIRAERAVRRPDHVRLLPVRILWRLSWTVTGVTRLGVEVGALGQGRFRQMTADLMEGLVELRPAPPRPGLRREATLLLQRESHVDVGRVPC